MIKYLRHLLVLALFFILGLGVFGIITYGDTNVLVVENNSSENICIFPYPDLRMRVEASSKLKMRFKVKGDGGISIKICDQNKDLDGGGYFTPTSPSRHTFIIDENLKVTSNWESMVW